MKALIPSLFAGLLLSGGHTLATKYSTERNLKFEISSSMSLEVTSMEMEVDGEPQEIPGGHAPKTEFEYTQVIVDHPLEVTAGKPTKVRRTFEKVGGTTSMTMGEESTDTEMVSPFQGLMIELAAGKDGAVEIEVVDGKKPENEGALDGQQLPVFLDGLLPAEEVEVDATWDLEKAAIASALRLDVRKAMYPRPERSGERGGEGGGRRPGGGGRGGGASSMLDDADWKGTAKLISVDKEIDGISCSIVELKLEAAGEREIPAMGGPRGGAFDMPSAFENKVTYEVTLEGTFAFANKEKRPVKLQLEGKIHSEATRESERGEHTMKSHSVQSGAIEFTVECSESPFIAQTIVTPGK